MNLGAMIAQAQRMIGDANAIQFDATDVKQWINDGQRFVATQLEPIYNTTVYTSLDNVVNNPCGGLEIGPSSNFIRIMSIRWNTKVLRQVNYSDVYRPGAEIIPTTQEPEGYFVLPFMPDSTVANSRRIEFYPPQVPGTTATIHLEYLYYPPDLVNDLDESPLPLQLHRYFILFALYMCKMQENDLEAAAFIMERDIKPGIAQALSELSGEASYDSYGTVRDAQEYFTTDLF